MKLCDTSVLVDIDRGGIDHKVQTLDDEGRHAICVVTVTEMRLGVEFQYEAGTDEHQNASRDLDRLISRFNVIPVSRSVATAAASIIGVLNRSGQPIDDLHDIYIGATAHTEELQVLTDNVDHFERIPDIEVVKWADY